ncbi:MAG: hypothetical protein Q8Q76_03215 [Methylotenera sp.]|nr:hypothetical protein [Methylotenera sp.]
MTPFLTSIFSIVAAIMLFLHGLASFSEGVTRLGEERLREIFCKLTCTDLYSALVSSVCTALAPLANLDIAADQVALVHALFNLAAASVTLIILPHAWPALSRWLNRGL